MTRTEHLRVVTKEIKATVPKTFSGQAKISYDEAPKFRQMYEMLNSGSEWEKFLYRYILTLEYRIAELENRIDGKA